MTEQITDELIKLTENYLKGYALNRNLLRLERFEREFMGGVDDSDTETEGYSEATLARPRMYDIRHFIMGLPNSDEKILLYYHYVKRKSIEKCAELLGISRSSAFRKKKKALCIAAEKYLNEKIPKQTSLQ